MTEVVDSEFLSLFGSHLYKLLYDASTKSTDTKLAKIGAMFIILHVMLEKAGAKVIVN